MAAINPVQMLRDSPWGWNMAEQTPGVGKFPLGRSSSCGPTLPCAAACTTGPTSDPWQQPPFAPLCRDNRTGNPFPSEPLPPRPCEYDAYQTVVPVHWSLGGGVVGISTYLRRF